MKNGGLLGGQLFQIDVDLQAPTYIAHIKELAFAHVAMGGNSSRHTDPLAFPKSFSDLADGTGDIEPPSKWIDLLLDQLLQLLTAERKKVIFFHC